MVRLVMVRSVWQVVVVLDSVGKVGARRRGAKKGVCGRLWGGKWRWAVWDSMGGVERQNSVGVAKNRWRKWIRVRWSMKVVGSSNGWWGKEEAGVEKSVWLVFGKEKRRGKEVTR